MPGNFIKCPRCELNYIDKTKQTYCDVCLAELKLGPSLKFADLEDDEDLEAMELCPICKQNYIKYNEDMCEDCRTEKQYEKDDIIIAEDDETWKEFLDEEAPVVDAEDSTLSLSQLEDEEELFDDEESEVFDENLDELDDDFDAADEDFDEYDEDEDEDNDEDDDE